MAKKTTKEPDPRLEILKMLTPEQKDKLLLKLFRKEPILMEKLAFEFFEDKSDLEKRRNDLRNQVDKYISERYLSYPTPGELMMNLRSISGQITEHVKITKDKYGEVEINILMLNTAFERFFPMLTAKVGRSEKFSEYVVKRTITILKLLEKLHEDNLMDFKDDLNQLFSHLHTYKGTSFLSNANDIPKSLEI